MSSFPDEPTALMARKDLGHLITESESDEAFAPPPTAWLVLGIVAMLALLFWMIVTH
jgi:hypothetical protein